jgi:hypothetical protein
MLQERLEPFNPSNHNIVDWVELFQLYVELHDIGAAKTKNLLLTHVQHEVFATLKNLVAPEKITEAAITTAKLTQLLEKHYRVVTNKHVARQAFARLVQGPAESVTQFSLRLRKGALECDFGAQFDERLRDQILIGIADVQFKEKIYTDATLDTFDKVVQAAVDKEHIHAQMKRLTIQSSNQEVNAIQSSYSTQQRGNTNNFSSRPAREDAVVVGETTKDNHAGFSMRSASIVELQDTSRQFARKKLRENHRARMSTFWNHKRASQ